jgi:hypothetical protein
MTVTNPHIAKAETLVATTINPYKSLGWQLKCYDSFKSSGHEIASFNYISEIKDLQGAREDINVIELKQNEVGLREYGKPLAKILSVLRRMRDVENKNYYILINSDIYYTGRKACTSAILNDCDAAALTRSDFYLYPNINSLNPYRGGLDIFLFSRSGLLSTIDHLRRLVDNKCLDQLAFGIPGWDYLIGSIIRHNLGGKILDADNLFLHFIHPKTYNDDLEEFRDVASYLAAQSIVSTAEPQKAASEFVEIINGECELNSHLSTMLSHIFFNPKSNIFSVKNSNQLHLGIDIMEMLVELYSKSDSVATLKLFKALSSSSSINFRELFANIASSPSFHLKISQLILMASVLLQCGISKNSFTTEYPLGNSHRACLDNIQKLDNREEKNYYLTELFYAELLQDSIFNRNLFEYIVCIQTDKRLVRLLSSQLKIITSRLK